MQPPYSADPKPQAAPPGSQNGERTSGAKPMDLSDLAQMVAQREAPDPAEPESPTPTQPAEGSPETPAQPATQEEAGKENLTPDEQPAGSETPEGEPGNEVPTDENALSEALKGLNPDAQKHLMEMAEAIRKGETSIGQLKRGHRLAGEFKAEIEGLKGQLEELKAQSQAPKSNGANGTPKTVAGLRTLDEVRARQAQAKESIRALEDFLEENPEGGRVGDREMGRKDLLRAKRDWEDELDALPERAEQIRAQAEAQALQRAARQSFEKDFPWITDPDNPRTEAVQEKLAAAPWLRQFQSPEYAAAVWLLGEQAMAAELAGRKAQAAKPSAAAKPAAGKVPAGKPHQAPGTVPPRMGSQVSVEQALKSVQEEGSRNSLSALLTATGR